VKLVDLNLLLYAYHPHVGAHERARRWWEGVLNGEELIGFPHEILFGFVRIATNPRLREAAVPLAAADKVVRQWIDRPHSRVLHPDPDHYRRTIDLMRRAGAVGRVLSDAVLASYAIAHRATLCSTDSDFDRFPGLDWTNPLETPDSPAES